MKARITQTVNNAVEVTHETCWRTTPNQVIQLVAHPYAENRCDPCACCPPTRLGEFRSTIFACRSSRNIRRPRCKRRTRTASTYSPPDGTDKWFQGRHVRIRIHGSSTSTRGAP